MGKQIQNKYNECDLTIAAEKIKQEEKFESDDIIKEYQDFVMNHIAQRTQLSSLEVLKEDKIPS